MICILLNILLSKYNTQVRATSFLVYNFIFWQRDEIDFIILLKKIIKFSKLFLR